MAGKSSEVVFDYQNHKILVPPAGMLDGKRLLAGPCGGAGAPCDGVSRSWGHSCIGWIASCRTGREAAWQAGTLVDRFPGAPLAFFLGSLISVPNACLGSISAMLYLMRYSSPIPPSSTRSNQSAMWGGTASPTVRRSGDLGCPLPADV
jgi:hypothetical protein